ncbi:hypothetical protein COP2_033672 [Malus domestica]
MQELDQKPQSLMMQIAMMGMSTFFATSIAKHMIPSVMTQLKGRRRVVGEPYDSSSFLVRVMSRSRRSGLVTDLSDETMSIKGGMVRGWVRWEAIGYGLEVEGWETGGEGMALDEEKVVVLRTKKGDMNASVA